MIALWLVLAYTPAIPRPELSYPAWSTTTLAMLAAAGLVVFLAIQAWIVRATDKFLGDDIAPEQAVILAEFRLSRKREIMLTALPILMTLVVAWLSYPLWASLIG